MRRGRAIATLSVLAGLAAAPALGSGGPEPEPLYIERHGGTAAELAQLHRGRLGVVMARAPAALLYLDWRLLHGLRIGERAGAALSAPCCDIAPAALPGDGVTGWLAARALVPGAPASPYYLSTERPGPDYSTIPNCFADAFDTAAATLRDRIARHGRDAPAVRFWLAAQDAVFDACASATAALPPAPADSPAWLTADRAYQEAAFALYNRRTAEAAGRFAAIARNPASPWRPMALYLGVRAFQREALANPSPAAFARARAVIAALAATPAGTYGRGEVVKMERALAYRDRPAALLAELDAELNRPEPAEDIDLGLTDYLRLAARAAAKPEAADWIETLRARDRLPALAHARERWASGRDPAWLVAALSLVSPGDEAAAALAADAARIEAGEPGWASAQYHHIRLTLAGADPAATRARLDALLSRPDSTLSERNMFTAIRAQVAADLDDFARFALRRPYCAAIYGECLSGGDSWGGEGMLARRGAEWVGLGPDARAILDRLPLAERIAFSRNPALPAELRLDVALTGFARAVQLQDERAIGTLAADLALLLPQLRRDWRAIAALPPGPARRFAEFYVMAKIPGLRTDLDRFGYTRPQGNEPDFQGHWVDWLIVPRGAAPAAPAVAAPALGRYAGDDYWQEEEPDLTCLANCGAGAFPLHLPRFVAALQGRAAAERAHFIADSSDLEGAPRALPAGTLSAWDEALSYARAHPRDPRSPELLYRLIRVARWGGNHDHLGRRAFRLLHARYAGSDWARRSPYYFD
jgi:hypothetical protein